MKYTINPLAEQFEFVWILIMAINLQDDLQRVIIRQS